MNINFQSSQDITRIAKYYKMDRDEVVSEAWILAATAPDLTEKAFFARISSICIESNKTNGLQGIEKCAVDSDSEEANNEESVHEYGRNPEQVAVEREEFAERSAFLGGLDTKRKSRLAALEDCQDALEFGRKAGLTDRTAQKLVASWIAEESATPEQETVEMF